MDPKKLVPEDDVLDLRDSEEEEEEDIEDMRWLAKDEGKGWTFPDSRALWTERDFCRAAWLQCRKANRLAEDCNRRFVEHAPRPLPFTDLQLAEMAIRAETGDTTLRVMDTRGRVPMGEA